MAVMVLGGAGFIGAHVIRKLVSADVSTISYDLFSDDTIEGDVRWIKASVLELNNVERFFFEYEVDSVIQLIGLPTIGYCEKNPHLSFLLNVVSVQNSLEAMRKTDTKRIVFASSAAIYGQLTTVENLTETTTANPTTIYGYHKLIAEQLIKSYCDSYGIEYAILRLFNVYGGHPSIGKDVVSIFLRRAMNNEPINIHGAEKVIDFVHVEDVAEVFKRSLKEDMTSEIFCIGSGRKTTLRELAGIYKEIFKNLDVKYEESPDDGTGFVADITKVKSMLGFSPRDPKMGIRRHILDHATRKARNTKSS